jgi:transcription elongation factor Elf1
MSDSFRHHFTKTVTCPHCGHAERYSTERLNDNTQDGEDVCGECDKDFVWSANIEITYSTEKPKQKAGAC